VSRRPIFILVVMAFALAAVGTASAAKAPKPKKYATTITTVEGRTAPGPDGLAPEILGQLGSKDAACLKSRTVTATFLANSGTSIPVPDAKTLTDGSWSVSLAPELANTGGTIEVTVRSKGLGAKGSCGSATKKVVDTVL
jgi:hypothetical protein